MLSAGKTLSETDVRLLNTLYEMLEQIAFHERDCPFGTKDPKACLRAVSKQAAAAMHLLDALEEDTDHA